MGKTLRPSFGRSPQSAPTPELLAVTGNLPTGGHQDGQLDHGCDCSRRPTAAADPSFGLVVPYSPGDRSRGPELTFLRQATTELDSRPTAPWPLHAWPQWSLLYGRLMP